MKLVQMVNVVQIIGNVKDEITFSMWRSWNPSFRIDSEDIWTLLYTCFFKIFLIRTIFLSKLLFQIGMMETRSKWEGMHDY
jgi:hypothetical protein